MIRDNVVFCPSRFLANKTYAVRVNGTVYVSPAVWDLILSANDREMKLLLESVKLIDLDNPAERKRWKEKFGEDVNESDYGKCLRDA